MGQKSTDIDNLKKKKLNLDKENLEKELFGLEQDAFYDEKKRKIGLLQLVDGGTLFLDEISELDYSLQTKLLHVL